MQQNLENFMGQTEAIFGDVLCKLYPFIGAQNGAESIAWRIPIAHEHSFYEFMLAGERGYRIVLEDKAEELKPHHGYIIPSGIPHCASETDGIPIISIGFSIELCENRSLPLYRSLCQALQVAAHRQMPLSEETERLIKDFYLCNGNRTEVFFRKQVLAYRLMYSIFRDMHVLKDESLPGGSQHTNVVAALEFLLERRQYRLEEIAKFLGYTPKYTAQLIRKHYGCDYRTLRRKMILDGAKNYLLSDQKLTVAEIAHLLGYKSESAFYNFFKRETGYTPYEFRKKTVSDSLRQKGLHHESE